MPRPRSATTSRLLRGIPVVVVQNGLGGIASAQAASPRSDVVGGLAMFASSYLSPGEITITTGGPIYLGGDTPDDDLPARYALSVLAPVMGAKLVPNFRGAQWTKLVVNMVNALPAITGLSAQAVISDRRLRRILTASIRETVRIGLASSACASRRCRVSVTGGCDCCPCCRSGPGRSCRCSCGRGSGRCRTPGRRCRASGAGSAPRSTHLNGAVVAAAEAIGRTAPVNAALVAMVHEVEDARTFLDPAEVVTRIGTP